MSDEKKEIYVMHRPLKILIRVAAILIAVLILLSVVVFLGFQKYIVYTPDGVKLDIPFLEQYRAAQTAEPTASHSQ